MGDLSRWSFDPHRDYFALLSQQGRVDTEADRNEAAAIVSRRIQAGTLDTIGRAAVPRETPDGFRIEAAAGKLAIGHGRIYVDGILAENRGLPCDQFDPHLAELTRMPHAGEPASSGLAFEDQPWAPFLDGDSLPAGFTAPTSGGPHVAYLKVWNREVDAMVEPRLIEKALGVDTTTRLQTVWQVKVLSNVGSGIDCRTALADIPDFTDTEPAAAARLTSKTVELAGAPNPCELPVSGGYRGRENQLYRVEIHTGGATGTATFKWSRDNACVASRVESISSSRDHLVVDSIGRDEVLRFSDGDWVEVTDDWRELAGLPGDLRRITSGGGVDDATRTLVLDSPLSADFPVDANQKLDPARNTRVRRWDQRGKVLRATGTTLVDLDAAGANGEIPVHAGGAFVILESNIAVQFDLAAAGGQFRTGDYWLIAARTFDASIELLDQAPPIGIHAHYTKLAIVTLPDTETDCRKLWPPEAGGEDCCDCTVCVSEESHRNGEMTIQKAINSFGQERGGTICLGPGDFLLASLLQFAGTHNVRMRGHGPATMLHTVEGGTAIELNDCEHVTLEDFEVASHMRTDEAVVSLHDSQDIVLQRLVIKGSLVSEELDSIGVLLRGGRAKAAITDCRIAATTGILGGPADEGQLDAIELRIEDNDFACSRVAILMNEGAVHQGDTRICGNRVGGCTIAGFSIRGGVLPGSTMRISRNRLAIAGHGMVLGTDGLLVTENEILGSNQQVSSGIQLVAQGLDYTRISASILANRITEMRGHGIHIDRAVALAMIKMNVFAGLGGSAVFMGGGASGGVIVVENNQILDVGTEARGRDPKSAMTAMTFLDVDDLQVRTNTIAGVAQRADGANGRAAILVGPSKRIRIEGNEMSGVGPSTRFGDFCAAILVVGPFEDVLVASNRIARLRDPGERAEVAEWRAIEIIGLPTELPVPKRFMTVGTFSVATKTAPADRPAEGRAVVVTDKRVFATPTQSGRSVAILGNSVLSESSRIGPVQVTGASACRLSDNRIVAIGTEREVSPSLVQARHAVVSSNELMVAASSPRATVLLVKVLSTSHTANATVIGNVRNGLIGLNGSTLVATWLPLNPFVRA
jgi:uncharacterized protein DUF6519